MSGSRVGVPVGSFNHAIGVIGDVKCGKSTIALWRAWELAGTPAYVFAYDPTWRLPRTLPGGVAPPIRRYQSLDECARAIEREPSGIHAPLCEPDRLLGFALAVGRAAKGGRRVPEGTIAPPVVLLLDEAVLVEATGPGRLRGSKLLKTWTGRRWEHCALIYTAQTPRIVDLTLLSMATELYLFRCVEETARDRLRREAGVPKELVDRLPTLGRFEYELHRPGG